MKPANGDMARGLIFFSGNVTVQEKEAACRLLTPQATHDNSSIAFITRITGTSGYFLALNPIK